MTDAPQQTHKKKKIDWTPYILLTPAFLLVGCIIIYPILNAIYTSFFYYNMTDYKNIHFVGLQNYIDVWSDAAFLESLGNTVKWVVITVSFQFVLGLGLALLLNQPFHGRGLIRSVCFIPWVTPSVVIALIWSWIYNGNFGILNILLRWLGILSRNVAWLSDASVVLYAEIATMVWQGLPFFTIMILASIQTVPYDLYEAADVEGAGRWKKFQCITWPHILPTVVTTILLRIIWVFNNVDVLYLMSGGGPGYSSMTLSLNAYIKAQKSLNFGYGATIAVYGTIVILIFMSIYLKAANKLKGTES